MLVHMHRLHLYLIEVSPSPVPFMSDEAGQESTTLYVCCKPSAVSHPSDFTSGQASGSISFIHTFHTYIHQLNCI